MILLILLRRILHLRILRSLPIQDPILPARDRHRLSLIGYYLNLEEGGRFGERSL